MNYSLPNVAFETSKLYSAKFTDLFAFSLERFNALLLESLHVYATDFELYHLASSNIECNDDENKFYNNQLFSMEQNHHLFL